MRALVIRREEEKEKEEDDDDDDDGTAGRVCSYVRAASLIPKRIRSRDIIYTGGVARARERRGRDNLMATTPAMAMVMVVVPQVMVMVERLRLAARLLPVTTRELPYLNTMHYIVRVISYISPLNKHRLNI